MRRAAVVLSLVIAAAAATAPLAQPAAPASQADLERRFDAAIDPAEMGGWMKVQASEPNHVGTAKDKANAEMILAQFKAWGWDAHIDEFQVLYPTPVSQTLELLNGPKPFKATLTEKPVPGDPVTTQVKAELPAYVAYGADGDVTGELIYVNYGMPDDYKALERMGVDVKGKVVIARYGQGWRGLKPKLAQDHGAIGAIIYSDPRDDGYFTGEPYPKGPSRPPQAFQRGSVADMTIYPGDPLTPGIGATKDARRLPIAEAQTILKIPVIPISYADAQVFLSSLGGNVAPITFRGALPITYRVGPSTSKVHLAVKSDWSQKTIYDVVAFLRGSTYPDEWVMRGNHHDGWVFGASDPLSGHIAMMGEAKALGALAKQGWRPKRTLVYLSWDAEEPMLLGSTEWAEAHADELKKKGVIYINSDGNGRGFFSAAGSHPFTHLVNQVAADVTDPQTNVSVLQRMRARAQVAAASGQPSPAARAAADGRDMPIGPLGSGSDYSTFLQHLGVPALNVGFGGEAESGGVYHSAYDTYEHHTHWVDPGHAYAGALAKMAGRLMMRIADADVPVQRYGDFADTVSTYVDEVKALANTRRTEAETQARLISGGLYRLADDPRRTNGPPTPLKAVPYLNFAPLENAVDRLKKSARDYDREIAARGPSLTAAQKAQLSAMLLPMEQSLTNPVGLPGRPWYRHLIYAPGRFTGYGAKTLPGVREAIEEDRFADADRYSALTAQSLEAFAARLDQATNLIRSPVR
jgi:N-acetylated-alpha-linked acidic dipeptidase